MVKFDGHNLDSLVPEAVYRGKQWNRSATADRERCLRRVMLRSDPTKKDVAICSDWNQLGQTLDAATRGATVLA
jgi:hypothetical protein